MITTLMIRSLTTRVQPSFRRKPADYLLQTISNFGLIDRSYDSDPHADPDGTKTQWERFGHEVARLNRESGSKTQYKVLYSMSLNICEDKR